MCRNCLIRRAVRILTQISHPILMAVTSLITEAEAEVIRTEVTEVDMVEAIIIIIISQVMRTKVVVNLIVLREANGLEVTGAATVVAPTAVVLTAVAVLVTPTPFKLVSPSIAGQMGEVQVD